MSFPAARIGDLTAHLGTVTTGTPLTLIGGMPASRIGDLHTCPMSTPPLVGVPHVGGPIVLGAFNVLVGGPPQARVLDLCVCVGPIDTIVLGHFTTLIGMAGAFSGGLGGFLGLVAGGALSGVASLLGEHPRAVRGLDGEITTELGPNITVEGSPEYQAQVVRDLQGPRNRALVESIVRGDRHVTIRPVAAGSDQANASASRVSPDDALLRPDGSRGPGSDSIVEYNPSLSMDYRAEDGSLQTLPPEDILGHELIHADHNGRGENRRDIPDTAPGGDNQEEARTIGVHGYEDEPISERRMSEAAGRSPRPNHDAVESRTYRDRDGTWRSGGYDAHGNIVEHEVPAPNDRPNH